MATLTVTKTYLNGKVLFESDLDAMNTSLTTFFNTTLLDSNNVQAAGITGANIANNTITAANLAPACVGVAQLASSAITSGSLTANCITTNNFSLGSVGNSQIGAKNSSTSQSSGLASIVNDNSFHRITNLSTTITTVVGRPVWVGIIPDGSGGNGYTQDVICPGGFIRFTRNGTLVATLQGITQETGIYQHIDNPGPGTWTYAADCSANGALSASSSANYVALAAYEL